MSQNPWYFLGSGQKCYSHIGTYDFTKHFGVKSRWQGPSGDPHGILFGTYINGLV